MMIDVDHCCLFMVKRNAELVLKDKGQMRREDDKNSPKYKGVMKNEEACSKKKRLIFDSSKICFN